MIETEVTELTFIDLHECHTAQIFFIYHYFVTFVDNYYQSAAVLNY